MNKITVINSNVIAKESKWIEAVEKAMNASDDRSFTIVACSVLDVQLENLLKAFLIDDSKTEEMFKSQMPLATFSAKISMSYSMGLISKYEMEMLNVLRKIRNKFAHEIDLSTFEESQAIMDLCNNLKFQEKTFTPESFIFINGEAQLFNTQEFGQYEPRKKFFCIFKHLVLWFNQRESIFALQNKRHEIFTPSAYDFYNQIILEFEEAENETKKMYDNCTKEIQRAKNELEKIIQKEKHLEEIDGKENELNEIRKFKNLYEDRIQEMMKIMEKIPDIRKIMEGNINISYDKNKAYMKSILNSINKSYGEKDE